MNIRHGIPAGELEEKLKTLAQVLNGYGIHIGRDYTTEAHGEGGKSIVDKAHITIYFNEVRE